jgi:uncharacterized protein YecE (DUF72 family)
MSKPAAGQLDLFQEPATQPVAHPVGAAAVPADLAEVAAHMPAGIYLGTSSWHFPGWAGLVYDRMSDERTLGRDGLSAYAQHPLLGAVGIDRTFYAPLPRGEYEHYAQQVPAGFRFVVKAPMACTAPTLRTEHGGRGALNPHFLDALHASRQFVEPCIDGLGSKAGPLVFQFPPLGPALVREPREFLEPLRPFLASLPRGPLYAVEVRDRELMTDAYLAVLLEAGARPCLSLHPRMPVAAEQARALHAAQTGSLVVRWNLHEGYGYEEAKARYSPFIRLVDEDIPNRVALARLCLEAVQRGHAAYVIANNKAEGCGPLTVFKLAEQIVAAQAHMAAANAGADAAGSGRE